MTALVRLRHLPTEVDAIQFTEENTPEIRTLLTAKLGPEGGRWGMTGTHIRIETSEGDGRDRFTGDWIIFAEQPDGTPDVYPVRQDVRDRYEEVPS